MSPVRGNTNKKNLDMYCRGFLLFKSVYNKFI
jgi:hypothetical protein